MQKLEQTLGQVSGDDRMHSHRTRIIVENVPVQVPSQGCPNSLLGRPLSCAGTEDTQLCHSRAFSTGLLEGPQENTSFHDQMSGEDGTRVQVVSRQGAQRDKALVLPLGQAQWHLPEGWRQGWKRSQDTTKGPNLCAASGPIQASLHLHPASCKSRWVPVTCCRCGKRPPLTGWQGPRRVAAVHGDRPCIQPMPGMVPHCPSWQPP